MFKLVYGYSSAGSFSLVQKNVASLGQFYTFVPVTCPSQWYGKLHGN